MLSFLQFLSWHSRPGVILSAKGTATTSTSAQSFIPPGLLHSITECIPAVTPTAHKGQAGRLCVVGGSDLYTGAPYYAAMASLRTGGDLATVFCTEKAAIGIKSYSPEIIVAPYLSEAEGISSMSEMIPRFHSCVVGPGLGRDPEVLKVVELVIKCMKESKKPIIIDADGLYLITENPQIIRGYTNAILTPNEAEFIRLYKSVMAKAPPVDESTTNVRQLARALSVTIVCKGYCDIISDGKNVLICSIQGSSRRNGGQGDLLSGVTATFSYWMHEAMQRDQRPSELTLYGPNILAAYAACSLMKECSKQTFERYGRSFITTDMLNYIGHAFTKLFEITS